MHTESAPNIEPAFFPGQLNKFTRGRLGFCGFLFWEAAWAKSSLQVARLLVGQKECLMRPCSLFSFGGWIVLLLTAPGCESPSSRPTPPEPARRVVPDKPLEREKAVVGVRPKGQGYGGGLITEPISVYFKAPQMIAFQIQIPHAMNLYRAQHGHFPKTHEEFMEKIIKENGIQLPSLPPGARYVYDPQKAAQMQQYDPADPPLFVQRPAP